jgi:hypothetical protein
MNEDQNNKKHENISLRMVQVNIAIMVIVFLFSSLLTKDSISVIAPTFLIQIAINFILALICSFIHIFASKPMISAIMKGFWLSFGFVILVSVPMCSIEFFI